MRLNVLLHRNVSIKTRVALATFLTVSFVLFFVSSALLFYFHNVLRDSIYQQQFTMASEFAEQMDGRVQLARYQLSLAATEIDSKTLADPRALDRALTHLSPVNMIFDAGFAVIGTDGRVIAENMGYAELVGMDLNIREYVRIPLLTGKPYVSGPFRFILPPNTPLVALVTPIRDNNDKVICLLAGYHSLGNDQFLTSISSKGLTSGSYFGILYDHTIVMHSDRTRVLDTIPEGANNGIDQAAKGFEGTLDVTNSKGKRLLSSFKKIGGTGWVLAVNTPYDDAFGPLKRLIANTLAVSFIGVILSLVVIWNVTRSLTQPIKQLTGHISSAEVTAPEWKPIELNTGDEIEKLAHAFNSLMQEVQDTKQMLGDERDFFNGIIQNSAAPMLVIDRNHKLVFWNNAMSVLTGKNSSEMIGTDLQWVPFYPTKRPLIADLVLDRELDRIQYYYSTHSSSKYIEGSLQAEGWYENIGGKRRYIYFEAAPVRNRNNEIIAVVETIEDITERRLAEEASAKQSLFLNEIMGAIPDPVYYKDSKGIYLGCNEAFGEFFGKTEDEIIGRTLLDIMPEDYSQQSLLQDRNVIESGNSVRYETELIRADGLIRSALVSKAPFSNSDGTIAGIVGTFIDITDRRAVEADLARSRLELEAHHSKLERLFAEVAQGKREWEETLDHLRDFIILTDPEHRIRRYNKLLADAAGKPLNELIGLDWRDLLRSSGFDFVAFNGSTGEIFHRELARCYDITVYAIEDSGEVKGYVVSINDTTELRAATQELQKAYSELKGAQLQIFQQEKMASIGQLAAGVAHEINNPMGFISSNLATLEKYMAKLAEYINASYRVIETCSGDEAQALAHLKTSLKIEYIADDSPQLISECQEGASRVRRIVKDLMSFSRVDQAECALINLNETLETTIHVAWNEIKFVADFKREFGDIPEILCFPQQLNQVFLNLLVNAAHAMAGRQGCITIRTWSEDGQVFVSVSDTGCGIPDDIRQRIFEPFFTTKEIGKGTGLGLSISYEIIKKHGGEILVESEVGVGTTFTVSLPVTGPVKESSN